MWEIRSIFVTLLVVLLAAIIAGCAEPQEQKIAFPEPDGDDLYQYLTEVNYRTWDLWPGTQEKYSGEVHGDLLTTYISAETADSLESKTGELQNRSIIVKEVYGFDNQLKAILVMYKVDGYFPEHNNWFWARYSPAGAVEAEGKVVACIDCHAQQNANDYVFTGDLL